jgi:cyclic nucleotide gated channel alpha 3
MSIIHFFLSIGILIFATIIGSLGTMISSQNQSSIKILKEVFFFLKIFYIGRQISEKMDEIKRYMKFRSVNRKLEKKVIKWLDYLYTNRQVLNEEMVLNSDLSVELRKDLAIKVHLESLQQVKLFNDCETNLLIELVKFFHNKNLSKIFLFLLGNKIKTNILWSRRLCLSKR